MVTFNFLWWQPPLLSVIFEGIPYPPTPILFFYQNDRKGCTLHYLDGLGHFLFGFGATGKTSRGGGRHHPWEDEGYCLEIIPTWYSFKKCI